MLSSVDLVDLGEELRGAGFKLATHQYFSAQQLLLHVAALGITDKRRLATLLGPIFCSSVAEQRRFGELFDAWIVRRFPDVPPTTKADASQASTPKLGSAHVHRNVFAAVAAILLAAIVGWAFWQMQQPRAVVGSIVSTQTLEPIAGATIEFEGGKGSSDESGNFRIETTTRSLPARLKVSKEGFDTFEVTAGEDFEGLRKHLYLWPRLPAAVPVAIELTPSAAKSPSAEIQIEFPAAASEEPVRIGDPQVIDISEALPPVWFWHRLIWPDVALVSIPLVLFGLWQLWALLRRPALQRLTSRTPSKIKEVHLPGGVSPPTAALPLRRLAQELRRRRSVVSDQLRVRSTIDATLRNAGLFTPVRGSRIEPDYIALVDVNSQSDHQARLEDEIVRHLQRSDVLIERYSFHGDPTLCTPAASATPAAAVRLEELQSRCPDHRLLLFSDGDRLFNLFTGTLTPAAEILLQWSMPTLLTSKPLEQWGEIEWALDRRGFTVLPISRAGLTALMGVSNGAPIERFLSDPGHARLRSYERNSRRLLERDSPSSADIERLCSELREDFGERGFAWIAACAAYPEIHWGITLRLGAALVPDVRDQERLLPRIARLAWFREAYFPNWLREALLERLSASDEATTRALLHKVLASLSGEKGQEIPLRIALGAPRADTWWKRVGNGVREYLERVRIWRTSERLIHASPPDSPLRDYVFLRFISGSSVGKLSLSAPSTLLKLLFRGGSPLLGFQPAIALVFTLLASAAIAVAVKPLHDGKLSTIAIRPAITASGSMLSMFGRRLEESTDDLEKMIGTGILEMYPDGQPGRVLSIDLNDADEGNFSPTGRYFVIISNDHKHLALHETGSGRVVLERDVECTHEQVCFEFARDDTLLAYWERASNPSTAVENLESGFRTSIGSKAPQGLVSNFAIRGDGNQLAVTSGNATDIWDLTGGQPSLSQQLPFVALKLKYAEDRLLVFERSENLFREVREGLLNFEITEERPEPVDFAASKGKPLLAALRSVGEKGVLDLMDLDSGANLGRLFPAPRNDYSGVAFSPDGNRLVATTEAGILDIWSIPDGFPSPPRAGRSFALIVGIDYTESQSPIPNAIRDAKALAAMLTERFGFGVTLILEDSLSASSLTQTLERFGEILNPEDRFLFYMNGYATVSNDSREFQYITRYDAKPTEVVDGATLARLLKNLPAESVLVIADTAESRSLASEFDSQTTLIGRRSKELIGSSSDGPPIDVARGGNSPFMVSLLKALASARGDLTAESLYQEIDRYMRRNPTRVIDSVQTPYYARLPSSEGSGQRSFVFPQPLTAPATDVVAQRPTPRPTAPPIQIQEEEQQQAQQQPQQSDPLSEPPPVRTLNDDITLTVPPELRFSYAGRSMTQTFTLVNPGPYRWNLVANIEGPNARDFRAEGCELLREGSECQWQVTFNPTNERALERQATLVIAGSVERPQGTLSARIAPIPLRVKASEAPSRLTLSGDGGEVTDTQLSNRRVFPQFEIAGRESRGLVRVEVGNPLETPLRLAISRPWTIGGVELQVEKEDCTGRELQPERTCTLMVRYSLDSYRQTRGVPSTAENPYGFIALFEEGDTETDPDDRDLARIVVRGPRAEAGSRGATAN